MAKRRRWQKTRVIVARAWERGGVIVDARLDELVAVAALEGGEAYRLDVAIGAEKLTLLLTVPTR